MFDGGELGSPSITSLIETWSVVIDPGRIEIESSPVVIEQV